MHAGCRGGGGTEDPIWQALTCTSSLKNRGALWIGEQDLTNSGRECHFLAEVGPRHGVAAKQSQCHVRTMHATRVAGLKCALRSCVSG